MSKRDFERPHKTSSQTAAYIVVLLVVELETLLSSDFGCCSIPSFAFFKAIGMNPPSKRSPPSQESAHSVSAPEPTVKTDTAAGTPSVVAAISSKVGQAKHKRLSAAPAAPSATPSDQMRVASSGRRKVALPPGRSQLDWIRNSRELPRRRHGMYTLAELRQHDTQGDAWMAVRGVVYDVTPYLEYHPGGIKIMMAGVGRDATKLFEKYHAWVNPEFMLERCAIGMLDERTVAAEDSDSC